MIHPPLLVKRLDQLALIPTVAHPGKDSGFDLYALEDVFLQAGHVTRVRTGVAVAMEGFGFRIADRSSMAMAGVQVVGGVIDEGYTGEMFVNLAFTDASGFGQYVIRRWEKIAQFIPQRTETACAIVVVQDLPESARGVKGFGSTGR